MDENGNIMGHAFMYVHTSNAHHNYAAIHVILVALGALG